MLNTASQVTAEIQRQQALSTQIANLQTDISSGVKVHVASDDPQAAARIAQIGREQSASAVYTSNINLATAITGQIDTGLQNVTNSLVRAKELMLQASNGTMNADDRQAAITELQGIQQQIATVAGTKDSSGNPLFTTATPTQIPIGQGVTIAANDSYDEVFGKITLQDGTTASIDDILNTAISTLQITDDTTRNAAVQTSLASINSAASNITNAQANVGVRENRLSTTSDSLATQGTNLSVERSGLEETDATQAIATMQQKMTVLSAAQSILAQLSKLSLFDKIA